MHTLKQFLLVTVLALACLKGNTQDHPLVVGPDAGAGFSVATATDSAGRNAGDYTSGLALFIGVQAEYRMSELISIRSGLYYESKCSKYASNFSFFGISQGIEGTNRFNYLTLPLALHFSFGEGPRFYMGAGPVFGFLLSQKSEVTTTGFFGSHSTSTNKDPFKPVDIGLTSHIGVGIPLGEQLEFSLTVRDNLGLSNMFKDEQQNGKMKFNCVYLTLGLGILL